MADTTGAKPAKTNSGNLEATKEQGEEERGTIEQIEEHNLSEEVIADEEQREEDRRADERDEQQDLNQGMQTGTYDDGRTGINWGPDYEIPNTRKPEKKDEPNKKSD